MAKKRISRILSDVLSDIKPSEQEIKRITLLAKELISLITSQSKGRIKPFIGGSLVKGTIIKKRRYDIDIFARFSSDYRERDLEMSNNLERVLRAVMKRFERAAKSRIKMGRIHGSRDYFNLAFFEKEIARDILFEIVPTLHITKPKEAKNVTDLSFFHVNYVLKETRKKPRIADEIRLAKAFCYAQNCYGAESYVKGFSGYALELLVAYYKGFFNLLKKASSWKQKVVIDPAKFYKNEDEIMTNVNEAKLQSPIVLIDPTFSQRNVCAAVSDGTFIKFVGACRNFLAHPRKQFFEKKAINKAALVKEAKKLRAKLATVKIFTSKDKEDIAAAKLVKFCDFLVSLMERKGFFIREREFELISDKKKFAGRLYVIYKEPSLSMVVKGPPLNAVEGLVRFKKKYKKCFIDNERAYARVKRRIRNVKDVLKLIKKGNEMRDMQISRIELLK